MPSPPGVIILAVFHGAKDTPAYGGGGAEEQEWITTVDRGWGRFNQIRHIRGGAWRLLADADHGSRNYPNLTTTGINDFGAASGVSHKAIAGICLRTLGDRLKSLTAVDQDLTLHRLAQVAAKAGKLINMSIALNTNRLRIHSPTPSIDNLRRSNKSAHLEYQSSLAARGMKI